MNEKLANTLIDLGVEINTYQDGDAFVKTYQFNDAQLLAFREEAYQAGLRSNEDSKNNAYHERNMLVCALTRLFPAYLARHDEKDTEWENDWRWIVYIDLPTGQVSWHIHDSERNLFDHLEVKENKWDGHNTERKYQRLMALTALSEEIKK